MKLKKILLLINLTIITCLYAQQEYDIKRLPYSNYIQRVDLINISSSTYINIIPYQPQTLEIYSINLSSNTYTQIVDKNWNYFNVMIINDNEDYSILISTYIGGNQFKLYPQANFSTSAKTNLYAIVEPNGTQTKINVILEK